PPRRALVSAETRQPRELARVERGRGGGAEGARAGVTGGARVGGEGPELGLAGVAPEQRRAVRRRRPGRVVLAPVGGGQIDEAPGVPVSPGARRRLGGVDRGPAAVGRRG